MGRHQGQTSATRQTRVEENSDTINFLCVHRFDRPNYWAVFSNPCHVLCSGVRVCPSGAPAGGLHRPRGDARSVRQHGQGCQRRRDLQRTYQRTGPRERRLLFYVTSSLCIVTSSLCSVRGDARSVRQHGQCDDVVLFHGTHREIWEKRAGPVAGERKRKSEVLHRVMARRVK